MNTKFNKIKIFVLIIPFIRIKLNADKDTHRYFNMMIPKGPPPLPPFEGGDSLPSP
jgi:hypothetical protein